jgi:hypothetical protein
MRKLRLGFGSIALNGIVVPDARIMYHINNQKDPQYSVFHGSYKVQTRRYFIPYSSSNQADKYSRIRRQAPIAPVQSIPVETGS